MTRREYVGAAPVTTLAASIASGSLSFTVTTGGGNGYPTGAVGPFFVVIEEGTANEEKVLVANRSGDLFNVAGSGRGADGTQAVGHDAGKTVRHVHTATDADEANAHVNANSGVHGRSGDVVGTTDSQTLTNKTISGASNTLSAIPQSAVTNLPADLSSLDTRLDTAETDITNLEAADIALDGRLDALETAPTMQAFTSSGTWNKPAGLRAVRVRVLGGGGGGGGAAATTATENSAGTGGSAGGYSEEIIPAASLASTEAVTVGAGGAGNSGVAGDAGGTSSFGTTPFLSAAGGLGGSVVESTAKATANGPSGGSGSGGTINITGQAGGGALVVPAEGQMVISGDGGDSVMGTGGRGRLPTTGLSGDGGDGYGSGGGGAANTNSEAARTGGSGRPGIVIVENIF